jgi:hypothetical protein
MSSRRSKKIVNNFDNFVSIFNNRFKEFERNNNENIDEDFDKEDEIQKNHYNYDVFLEKGNVMLSYTYNFSKFIFSVSGVYLLWICLHYFASHLYVKLCVPNTVIGFLISPFMTATPHCQGLRWVVYNAANMINNMWIVCGSFICSTILKINPCTTPHTSSS